MRPSCDAGVSLGCGAPAAPGWEVDAATVGDDPAVDAVDDETVAAVDDDAAAADEARGPGGRRRLVVAAACRDDETRRRDDTEEGTRPLVHGFLSPDEDRNGLAPHDEPYVRR